ncbi:App1 family protein [Cellulomonas bogoriensis]|uniref:ACP synthase n=1 Tax=Cellulomonas bogoriensis 69B4 = DSM 16987 TaxID=1386082 RepID=A0A0A0BZN8_9CELL|nr:phosphatase domain-containing protein [Cellulomonas bogoriensis]KGM13396.1 ACP synthase [Cellulomonas bogoriensis 69B4 = DSM 16987]
MDDAEQGVSEEQRSSRPHGAARLEDRAMRTVTRRLRRRGWEPRVEAYTGYGTNGWVRVLGRTLLASPRTTSAQVSERDAGSARRAVRGWRSFVTAQVAHAEVEVTVGDVTHVVRADRGGYVDAVLPADLAPGWHQIGLGAGAGRTTAPVLVVGPEPTTALLSDIDDTVMVTALPRPLLAAWNSLVLHESARRVVPGMAHLYRRWQAANPDGPTFYLSTGAWNVAPALRRFLQRSGYPAGPLLLTDWGPTNTGWFRSGQDHKRQALRRLMRELPQVRWVLVGDDGQHDPAIYRDTALEHPGRVQVIAVRQLTPAEQVLAHGTPAPFEEAPRVPWEGGPLVVHGGDGNALALRLIDAGVLPTG